MLSLLIQKELKNIIASPKFAGAYLVCSVLILLSVFIGINEYRSAARQYETATKLAAQEMRETPGWMGLAQRVYRKPDPMQIFVSGVTNDIGRWSSVGQLQPVKLRHSMYSDDPLFAIFRFLDFSLIAQLVFSLLAIVFAYDAVNGERESGTLALTFSYPVSRANYLLGKFFGAWTGLVIPLLAPIAISASLLFVYAIPFDAGHWIRLISLIGISLLYFSFFLALALCLSALTRNSNVSFLLCLVAWVVLLLVLPRIGVAVASRTIQVPTAAQMEARSEAYGREQWEEHGKWIEQRFRARRTAMEGMSAAERQQFEDDHLWQWMEEDDSARRAMQKSVDGYGVRLREELQNRKASQEQLAFALARSSPAAAFQLAAMEIAGTGPELRSRYENELTGYRRIFNEYTERKQKESGGGGGIRVTMDTEKGFSFDVPRERGTLNLTDMPAFPHPRPPFSFPVIDAALIAIFTMVAFAGGFLLFVRYDVR